MDGHHDGCLKRRRGDGEMPTLQHGLVGFRVQGG